MIGAVRLFHTVEAIVGVLYGVDDRAEAVEEVVVALKTDVGIFGREGDVLVQRGGIEKGACERFDADDDGKCRDHRGAQCGIFAILENIIVGCLVDGKERDRKEHKEKESTDEADLGRFEHLVDEGGGDQNECRPYACDGHRLFQLDRVEKLKASVREHEQ